MCILDQVTEEPLEEETEDVANLWNSFNDEEEEEAVVFFVLQESTGYMAPALRALAVIHTVISLVCVVGYYCLKVGLPGTRGLVRAPGDTCVSFWCTTKSCIHVCVCVCIIHSYVQSYI